jgi:hypothetical protein
MLPDTRGRFSLIQVNDNNGVNPGMTDQQIQQEAPFYDTVWGSFRPSVWDSAHPGMYVSRYVLPNEDIRLISGHDLAWFQTNHPDWILYACQPDGTLTHQLAYSGTGFHDVPLNIDNPDVVAYQLSLIGPNMISAGYNAIAADNIVFVNYLMGPNPEFGEGSVQPGWYGCGIWQGNTPKVIYHGGRLAADPTWIADIQNWVASAKNYLLTNSTVASHNFKLIVNHPPFSATPTADESTLLSHIDGLLDENGFTQHGNLYTGSRFANKLSFMQAVQNRNVAIFLGDYFCAGSTSCSTDPQSLTPSQVDWALATYALGNNGGAGLFVSPKGGAIYSYRSEYSARYGTPCGGVQTQGTLYSRRFSGGLAVANSGTSAQMFPLPAGHVYTDVAGRPVSNPLTVNGTDAYMLLTSGGCS